MLNHMTIATDVLYFYLYLYLKILILNTFLVRLISHISYESLPYRIDSQHSSSKVFMIFEIAKG